MTVTVWLGSTVGGRPSAVVPSDVNSSVTVPVTMPLAVADRPMARSLASLCPAASCVIDPVATAAPVATADASRFSAGVGALLAMMSCRVGPDPARTPPKSMLVTGGVPARDTTGSARL